MRTTLFAPETLTVTVADCDETEEVQRPQAEHGGAGRLRALLVEHDEFDADHIARWLTRQMTSAYELYRVTTLAAAVEAIENDRFAPDVILLDLMLPDAFDLIGFDRMATAAPGTPIIVHTDTTEPSLAERALRRGAQDYLTKDTMTLEQLDRSIRFALARNKTRQALSETISDAAAAGVEFAHGVAHDLRAPVRTARLLADRLRAELGEELTDLGEELSMRLDGSLAQIDDMILSMLEYSSVRGSDWDLRPTGLKVVVSSVIEILSADLQQAQAEVQIVGDGTVLATPQLIHRVFQNLLGNATKYRRPEVPLEILITITPMRDRIVITVADNGVGIPATDRERVFDALERLQPEMADGMGFGLSICRRIVDRLGGTIDVLPCDSPGTAVRLDLPAAVTTV